MTRQEKIFMFKNMLKDFGIKLTNFGTTYYGINKYHSRCDELINLGYMYILENNNICIFLRSNNTIVAYNDYYMYGDVFNSLLKTIKDVDFTLTTISIGFDIFETFTKFQWKLLFDYNLESILVETPYHIKINVPEILDTYCRITGCKLYVDV